MVFVINNYTPEDVERVKDMTAKAVRAGLEVGEQGTPHIQGAVVWNYAKTFKHAQQALCGKDGACWTQKMQGTWDEQQYCLKDGEVIRDDPYEDKQGKRNDLIAFRDAIKRGATDAELCEEHPGPTMKFQRFVGFARNAYEVAPDALPRGSKQMGIWIWSSTPNMLKTTWVATHFPDHYEKSSDRWWCDYEDQEVVLVDEPTPSWYCAFWNAMKIWCQEKPFRAQRGVGLGKKMIRFKRLFVCANHSPEEYFNGPAGKPSSWDEALFKSRFRVIEITSPLIDAPLEAILENAE